MGKKTVFLDRDGVVNRCAPPHQYIHRWEDFELLPGVPEAIWRLNEAGYRVVVVSNQRGVARGLFTMQAVNKLHRQMQAGLEAQGAHIDAVYVCPHEAGTCHCRKPDIGLFLQAENNCPVNKTESWMIGDFESDIQAGKNYGIRTILLGQGAFEQDANCLSLLDAAKYIIGEI